jgi:DNA-binding GntR family transcriptional regulator
VLGFVTIDHEGPVPVWRQLVAILRGHIESGEYPPGRPIPSENRLAQEHGLARATVRKAIGELKAEGLVQGVQGRGVFVAERP